MRDLAHPELTRGRVERLVAAIMTIALLIVLVASVVHGFRTLS